MRESIEYARLSDPCIEATLIVFGLGSRGNNMIQIPSVLSRVWVRQLVDIDIRVRGSSVGFKAMWPQESWIVMGALILVSPSKATEQSTAFPAMMTN